MKIAFDENVPAGMVRVFQTLAKERQLHRAMGDFEVVSAKLYVPSVSDGDYIKDSDVPWVTRFAADNGKVIISGDRDMLDVPHEMLALKQSGMVVVFFERQWSQWDFFRKSALLLHYWRQVAKAIQKAKPGTFLRVPAHWKLDARIDEIAAPGDKVNKKAPQQKAASEKGSKSRKTKLPEQIEMPLDEARRGINAKGKE